MNTRSITAVAVTMTFLAAGLPAQETLAHPPVPFLNAQGESVLLENTPLSLRESCNGCHDTDYIASHSYHVSLGTPQERARRFDPLTLEAGVPQPDSPTALDPWLEFHGRRHVGGGFAEARTEMNCFLCHLPRPNAAARNRALSERRFDWISAATLEGTPVIKQVENGWQWNPAVFDDRGRVKGETLGLRPPRAANCALCHGFAPTKRKEPFFLRPGAGHPETETTGAIFGADRIRVSGMNIRGKDALRRPWDVHAERLLECSDCHGSLNDPAYPAEVPPEGPAHLKVEPRRLDLKEFLRTPSHDFAKGHVSQGGTERALDGTMRRCESCHAAETTHDFLPYRSSHFASMQCEACHIPRSYAPARELTDWTLLGPDGDALVVYRGTDGDPSDPRTLIEGFTPVLLPRTELDGTTRLAPQNLMSVFFWVDEATGKRVSRELLTKAVFAGPEGTYRPELVQALDLNGDGRLLDGELRLDSAEKTRVMAKLLEARGVGRPAIRGEVVPYGVHHGVAPASWATRECNACHGSDSRVGREFPLADHLPGGTRPRLREDSIVSLAGEIVVREDGALVYRPDPAAAGLHVLGFGSDRWVDRVGRWAVILVLVGVLFHGGIRIFLYFHGRSAPGKEEGP